MKIANVIAVGLGAWALYELYTLGWGSLEGALSFGPATVDVESIQSGIATVAINQQVENTASFSIPASSFSGTLNYRNNATTYELAPVTIEDKVSWEPGETKKVRIIAEVRLIDVFANAASAITSDNIKGGNFFIKGHVEKNGLRIPITKQL